jgi:hypothetical protein
LGVLHWPAADPRWKELGVMPREGAASSNRRPLGTINVALRLLDRAPSRAMTQKYAARVAPSIAAYPPSP